MDGDGDVSMVVVFEPGPGEGFVAASEALFEVLSFADVEEADGAMTDGIDAGTVGESGKGFADGDAVVEGALG